MKREGRDGRGEGWGRGGGRVGPQAKAWPLRTIFLIELRNIKQEHNNMYEVQTNTNTEDYFLNVLVSCFKQKKTSF